MFDRLPFDRPIRAPRALPGAWLIAIVLMLGWTPQAFADDAQPIYTVVASTSIAAKGFEPDALNRLFLGRTRSIAGMRVSVVLLPYETAETKAFLNDVVKMEARRFKSYWRKRLFSSRGTPPKIVATLREAMSMVARSPGVIAVVPARTVMPEGVHAVAFIPPAPAAPPAAVPTAQPIAPPTAQPMQAPTAMPVPAPTTAVAPAQPLTSP